MKIEISPEMLRIIKKALQHSIKMNEGCLPDESPESIFTLSIAYENAAEKDKYETAAAERLQQLKERIAGKKAVLEILEEAEAGE